MTDLTQLPTGYALDLCRHAGEYVVASPAGGPVGVTNAFLSVRAGNIGGVRKVAQTLHDADTGVEYFRALATGGWTDWTERGGATDGGGGGPTLSLTTGAPDDGEGEDDDVRIDADSGDVYIKIGGSWASQGNIYSASDDAFWTTTVKVLNTARQSTDTVAADPELKFNIEANTKYRFYFRVWYETTSTADFKFALAGPASPTKIVLERRYLTPNATAYAGQGTYTSYAGPSTTINGTGGTQGIVELEGLIENGANAGDVEFQWAQGTSTAVDTTVLRGSYVEWKADGST